MPNTLTLASPITVSPFTTARIVKARDVDHTRKSITLDIELLTAEGARWGPYPFSLTIQNGVCDRLVGPHSDAPALLDTITTEQVRPDQNPYLANAYDRVMGAWITGGGETGMLDQLQQLGLLWPGTAS